MTGLSRMHSILLALIVFVSTGKSNDEFIDFNEENWTFFNAEVVEHLGRKSLMGTAMLKGVEFKDGIIDFDVAVNGDRSYPGIYFRAQSRGDYEHIYMRPHRAPYYPDALQYCPSFKGVDGWQLYNGDGYTSGPEIPRDRWIHVRIEILGTRGRIFLDGSKTPDLIIDHLEHGESKGWLTLNSPKNGSAYFSHFKVKQDQTMVFPDALKPGAPYGIVSEWELSQSFKMSVLDFEKPYSEQKLPEIKWVKVQPDSSGLVNISKTIARQGREPDCVYARSMIHSEEERVMEFKFGYSDAASVFLNGKCVFSGANSYRQRDPSSLGIIGLHDSVYLNLKKGENEILMLIAEGFGGWGFMGQDAKAVFQVKGLVKAWETEKAFSTSESVLYDPKRERLYVSNFDQYQMGNPQIKQHISILALDGTIEKLKWVTDLDHPLGMTLFKDECYVAERRAFSRIDLDTGKIIERMPVNGAVFLNDIAVDSQGAVFLTDSRKNVIWKCSEGNCEEWLKEPHVSDPNVLYIKGNDLFFGNSADQSVKTVDLKTKEIRVLAELGPGFVDGFRPKKDGSYLVSLWRGSLFQIAPEGEVTKVLDTTAPGTFSADFEYIEEKKLLIIPTFFKNTVVAYRMD